MPLSFSFILSSASNAFPQAFHPTFRCGRKRWKVFADQVRLHEWGALSWLLLMVLMNVVMGGAEERLMHVLQLVLLVRCTLYVVRASVYIIHHIVHTLVWLEVEFKALDCPQHLTWCS